MKLFAKIFKSKYTKGKLPQGWTETKVSEGTYVAKISQEQKDNWDNERREKDNVRKLSKTDGFHDESNGRQGTIYFVDNGKVCELFYEISGAKEYDILIWFDQLDKWILPKVEPLNQVDKQVIKEKLKYWLDSKNIRAEL